MFERLRKAGLKLKPTKCYFGSGKVTYLGFVVSQRGISPDPMKVEAVKSFPCPQNICSLRSFLGLASYYRRFIPKFSIVANPLFTLTKKDVPYEWSEDCPKLFEALKCALVEAPLPAYPDFNCDFSLETDASGVGLGAVLTQKHTDGSTRPIAYASRTLQPHEKNYGATELEALGVVWAVKHFRHCHCCEVITDHEALKSLLNTPHPSGKLARWGMALQEVDLVISYRPGKNNVLADALSRHPVSCADDVSSVSEEALVAVVQQPLSESKSREVPRAQDRDLETRQHQDPLLRSVIQYLSHGEIPDDDRRARELSITSQQYVVLDGVLYHLETDKTLRVVPPECD